MTSDESVHKQRIIKGLSFDLRLTSFALPRFGKAGNVLSDMTSCDAGVPTAQLG